MKIEMVYPQITSGRKVIDITEEEWAKVQSLSIWDQAQYILDNLNEEERDWSGGNKFIEGALDTDFAWIKEVKKGGEG